MLNLNNISVVICMVLHIAPVQFIISLWLSFLIYFHELIASFLYYADVYLVDHSVDGMAKKETTGNNRIIGMRRLWNVAR